MKEVKIFISYSHKDAEYLNELKQHLEFAPSKQITIWDDGGIALGQKWDDTIKKHLRESDIILLLISIDFLHSKYINTVELKEAFERHYNNECTVIPVFVRTCDLEDHNDINSLQGFPSGKFFSELGIDKDKYYNEFRTEIKKKISDIREHWDKEIAVVQNNAAAITLKNREQAEKKVSLITPPSPFGDVLKDFFKSEAEDQTEFNKWPFTITDATNDADLGASIFSVHIFTSEEDLKNDQLVHLFMKAATEDKTRNDKSLILWVSSNELMEKVPLEMKGVSTVIGTKPVEVIEMINSLEKKRQEKMKQEREQFAQQMNVYLLYDFSKDQGNEVRIQLKEALEKKDEIMPFYPSSDAVPGEIEEDLRTSSGVILFYGNSDTNWYCSWQSKVQKLYSLKKRAVCLSEPKKNDKIRQDVHTRAFMIMDDENKISDYVNDFVNELKHSA